MTINLSNIKVHYPGVKALDGITIEIRPAEVHGIIGENGAGKSTLMNVLSGSVRPTSGAISVANDPVTFHKAADAVAAGISLVSQEGTLVPNLSAAANICLGFEPCRYGCLVQSEEISQTAKQLLKRWFPATEINLDVPVSELPYASQKIVEILRALHSDPKILILDEPTATLSAREKESLWTLIRKLPGDGVGVVLISHFMSEVLQLSDRITALQDGKIVASVEKKGLTERDLVGFMFNRKGQSNSAYDFAKDSERKSPSPVDGNPVMSARQWTGHNFTVDDLEIHRGEIVGLIGLTGAGHADFAASIYQPAAAIAGALKIGGKDYSKADVSQMKKAGVAYVPDHRMTNALIGHWTIRENMSLINLSNIASRAMRIIFGRMENKKAEDLSRKLRVKASSVEQKISELSGGNKQKVSIARWLYAPDGPSCLFIFVEPTEGVDIGSKREIHDLIRMLADEGAAVLVVSSDLLEIAAVSDRVIPFSRGRNGPSIPKPEFSEQSFVDSIVGVAA